MSPPTSNREELRCWLWQRAKVLIGVGPDADWRAKLLIHQLMEGTILDASVQKPTSRRTFLQAARHLRA
jgi:hypothetical protein